MAEGNVFYEKVQFTEWMISEIEQSIAYIDEENDDWESLHYQLKLLHVHLKGLRAASKAYDATMERKRG